LRHTPDMPEWEPDLAIEPPPWMVEGARVLHGTFGLGTIGRVGIYKDLPQSSIASPAFGQPGGLLQFELFDQIPAKNSWPGVAFR